MLDTGRNQLPGRGLDRPDSPPYGPPGATSIIAVASATLALAAAVWLLSWTRALLIPLSFALLLAIGLRPCVDALQRLRVPRCVGAAAVLLTLPALALAVAAALMDAVTRVAVIAALAPLSARLTAPLATLLLAYLMLAAGMQLHRRALGSVSLSPQLRSRSLDNVADIGRQLRHYFALMTVVDALLLCCAWVTLHLCALAVLLQQGGMGAVIAGDAVRGVAAALRWLPDVGRQLAAGAQLLAAAVGLAQPLSSGLQAAALVLMAAVLLLSVLAGAVFATRLAAPAARMNAISVCVSVLCWGWLWGSAGLLLAIPMTLALKVICSRSQRLDWIDGLLSDYPRRRSLAARRALLRSIQRGYPG